MNDVAQHIQEILDRIEKACIASNRSKDSVRLLLATKTVPPERIKLALETGQTLIAENKVQELKEKYEALQSTPHENHFIGHLQTNKVKDILKYEVHCVQSLDRIDLAEKLHQRLSAEGRSIDVLLQVNTSNEESKYGVHPDQALDLAKAVAALPSLHIKGLMTIGLLSADAVQVRQCFQLLKKVQQEIAAAAIPGVEMKELSMGMSGDMDIAIEEGATIVRVGTAIFGKRPTPDSFYWNENN
ncbi:YggS family pyridoxal phosphate-dependent enzyme [Chitinophaga sp. Hz27]|uniref:YggS family pyridoxal phosphate-dependent enzyme n=1 Tax=Chitinophaga sp. Hz27 TaxID=3347169 RepID=UPI0035DEDA47